MRMLESKEHQQISVLVELLDLTFASRVRGWVGSECQIRSTGGLSISIKACYRPPPTQKRAIEPGEGSSSARPRGIHPDALACDIGPCGVGNGSDFKRPTARSIHLR